MSSNVQREAIFEYEPNGHRSANYAGPREMYYALGIVHRPWTGSLSCPNRVVATFSMPLLLRRSFYVQILLSISVYLTYFLYTMDCDFASALQT